jgi:hypothetical protein
MADDTSRVAEQKTGAEKEARATPRPIPPRPRYIVEGAEFTRLSAKPKILRK